MPTVAEPRRMSFNRVLLKVSGEGFCRSGGFGLDIEEVGSIAEQIRAVSSIGVELAVVIGGGNILRGAQVSAMGVNPATADYMGMLATVINGLALQDALEKVGVECRVLSAIGVHQVCEPFVRLRAIRHLEKGRVIILAGGTGNPFFTTDTAAALRATEIGADALLKATKVDGVYSADPVLDKKAIRYQHLTYDQVRERDLRVMDRTAITLCMENQLPIIVFNLKVEGNIAKVVKGDGIGTLITATEG